MRISEIIAEDGATRLIKPVSASKPRPAGDRYQTKPPKRTRYQNGNDSRFQTPTKAPTPTRPSPPK